jgi:hypothetical protein
MGNDPEPLRAALGLARAAPGFVRAESRFTFFMAPSRGWGNWSGLGVDRLLEEHPKAGCSCFVVVDAGRIRGERSCGRRLRALANDDLSHQVVAALTRHRDVAEEHVGHRALERRQCFGSRGCHGDDGALSLEHELQDLTDVSVVVDDEDADACERSRDRLLLGAARLFGEGKLDGEDRPLLIAGTLCADTPAVKLDQIFHEGEPDPEPAVRARRSRVRGAERLEELGQDVGGDPGAAVGYPEPRVCARALQAYLDMATGRRELDGVRDEVQDDLIEPERIGDDRRHRFVERYFQADRLLLRVGLHRSYRLFDDLHGLDGAQVEAKGRGGDARQVEEITDELRLRANAALDRVDGPRSVGVGRALRTQRVRPGEDRVERRPQLV